MKKPVLYLCGPINGRTDADCKDWREEAKALWEGDTKDPMDRDYRGRELECINEIVENDKQDIQASDALLVWFDKPSVGTSMEVFFAWGRSKPVVVVNRSDKPLSPWLVYHSAAVCGTLEEALNVCKARIQDQG